MSSKSHFQHIPNLLSISRLVMIFFIVGCLFDQTPNGAGIALVFYLVAVFTDFLDGYIARKYDCVSGFGKILDATVDKLFFFSILISLILLDVFSFKLLAVFIGIHIIRDVWVTLLRGALTKNNYYLGASTLGKIKTVLQFCFLFLGLSIIFLNHVVHVNYLTTFLLWLAYLVYIVSVALSIPSAYNYFIIYKENKHASKS